MKPARGAKSLMQCGNSLQNSGLVEVPAGRGVMLLSQLVVGEKLSSNPVARTLLENLIRYGATYKQVFRPVAVAVSEGSPLAKVLDAMGLAAFQSCRSAGRARNARRHRSRRSFARQSWHIGGASQRCRTIHAKRRHPAVQRPDARRPDQLQQDRRFRAHDPPVQTGAGRLSRSPRSANRRANHRRRGSVFVATNLPLDRRKLCRFG